jgi:hypothetical protein
MQKIAFKRLIVWLMFWVCLFGLGAVRGEAQESREYAVKTAFLYNFAKFVDWPPETFKNEAAPFVLGIVGVDPFGAGLETLKDKTVKGRKLVVRRLPRLENLDDCQILFISGSERGNLRAILGTLKNHSILTVSDIDHFANQGGMIGLVSVGNNVNFEINLDTVQQSKLKFSSQLLKLARIIQGAP